MLFYNNKNLKEQIENDYKELEKYKNSYNKKISLYNIYLDTMSAFEDGITEANKLNKEELENKKNNFQIQINKIDSNLELLNSFFKNVDAEGNIKAQKKEINKYNQKYKEIKNNYINNSISEEDVTTNYINGLTADLSKTLEKMKDEYELEKEKIINEKIDTKLVEENKLDNNEKNRLNIKNNDTLLISEKLGKVILPYKAEEVLDIFNNGNGKYSSLGEVIEEKFTRK